MPLLQGRRITSLGYSPMKNSNCNCAILTAALFDFKICFKATGSCIRFITTYNIAEMLTSYSTVVRVSLYHTHDLKY